MGCAIKRKVDTGSPLGHRQSSCLSIQCQEILPGCTDLENDFGVGFQPKYR